MSKKRDRRGFVYSTNPDFDFDHSEPEVNTLPPAEQQLRVLIDRKQRRGKEATLVTGFVGSEADLSDLGKKLKKKCGVGGSAKDGKILIQGNQRDKVIDLLKEWGYRQTKASGG
jgi:translation initiation factor 1